MAIEVGSKLQGRVTGITHFGAFVELQEGATGLVHITEIADSYVRDVNDHLKLQDVVTVKVINVDKNGKIGLSIRQAADRPADQKPARPDRPFRRERGEPGSDRGFRPRHSQSRMSFEDKLTRFLRDSEERISSLKKNTEGKRGGRGAKRF